MDESINSTLITNSKDEAVNKKSNHTFLDALGAIIIRIDPAGNCIYMNRTMLKFIGTTLEDLINDKWQKHIRP
jgi:PAS domain-containing protein